MTSRPSLRPLQTRPGNAAADDRDRGAHELENIGRDDALRLVLLYREAQDPRFERAALRWHARLRAETEALGLAGAGVSAQALIVLGGREVRRGVEALSQLLAVAGLDRAVKALDEWTEGLDRP